MNKFWRKPKVDPRLVELEIENRTLHNQVEYLVHTIRDMDQDIFNMSQCTSWEGMRPFFAKLKDKMIARKVAESNKIAEIMRPQLTKTYATEPKRLTRG